MIFIRGYLDSNGKPANESGFPGRIMNQPERMSLIAAIWRVKIAIENNEIALEGIAENKGKIFHVLPPARERQKDLIELLINSRGDKIIVKWTTEDLLSCFIPLYFQRKIELREKKSKIIKKNIKLQTTQKYRNNIYKKSVSFIHEMILFTAVRNCIFSLSK